MNLKLFLLRLLAARLATYRQGPARPELERARLARQRIALVKLDGIGDFALVTGLLQLIRQELPGAEVTYFCRQPVGELVRQQFPEWSVMEVFNLRSTSKEILLDQNLRRRLKSLPPFDLLLDLRTFRNFDEIAVVSWIPARQKIALKNARPTEGHWWSGPREERIYDRLLPLPDYSRLTGVRDLQNHAGLADYIFSNPPASPPRLTIRPEEQQNLIRRLTPDVDAPFLLVCPGAGAAFREYPAGELAKAVAAAVAGSSLKIVIAGGKQDTRSTNAFAEALNQTGIEAVNLTGTLNLAEHTTLMSLAKAVVCMETSHAHMAGALGCPAVVIIGGGHYGLFGPWGESPTFRWLTHRVPCFGCNWTCIHDRPLCIQDIPVETIAQNLAEVLSLS